MTDSRLMLLSTPAGQCFPSRNSTATASRGSVRETAICRTIEFAKWVWYGKGRVCRTNLSAQHWPGSHLDKLSGQTADSLYCGMGMIEHMYYLIRVLPQ